MMIHGTMKNKKYRMQVKLYCHYNTQ